MPHTPYTNDVTGAAMAAQLGIGCLIFALIWFYGIGVRSLARDDVRLLAAQARIARFTLVAALVLTVVLPVIPETLQAYGTPVSLQFVEHILSFVAALASIAVLASGRFYLSLFALVCEAALYRVPTWFPSSTNEDVALHLVYIGFLAYLLRPTPGESEPKTAEPRRAWQVPELYAPRQDLALFVIATAVGAFVCHFVNIRRFGSADEWAYTWQADMFAHFRAYGAAPPCGNALQTFYVFSHLGRAFAQYTPGWPLLMAPFSALRAVWLASPFCAGGLAVATARLSRRGAASLLPKEDGHVVTMAGWIGGLSLSFGTTYLLNVGSRYPHVATMMLFAWSAEAVLWLIDRPIDAETERGRLWWGVFLGSCVALCGATRPSDGATLELAIGGVFLWGLVKRRIGLVAFLGTTLGVVFWGGVSLVILRLQLGTWFTTGYSLNAIIFPWNVVRYSMPHPDQWRFSIPLFTGEYCWFPTSLAVGLVGLASLRKDGRLVAWSMAGLLPTLFYYSIVDMGARGTDWGYGPRYQLVLIVPMAIGTGVALGPLAAAATRRISESTEASATAGRTFFQMAGPWTLCWSAMIIGTLRLIPFLWPGIHEFVLSHEKVALGVARQDVHNAVVFVGKDSSEWDQLDETENLAPETHPSPDIVYAIDRTPELTQCVKDHYPGRKYYRARRGYPDVVLQGF